jgi:hypothetical protein
VLIVKFLLGEGCYHIYFMVILLYFYFSMPFWRWLVRWVSEKSATGIAASLAVLAALQVLLYQWSATYWNYPPWTQGHAMIIRLLNERMNYLPLFYGFVFVLGGVCAIHEKKIRGWLQCHFTSSLGIFLLSCALLVWKFKQYVLAGIPLEDIPAKYMTQLTPEGLVYTVCWLLFFSAALEKLEDTVVPEEENDKLINVAAEGYVNEKVNVASKDDAIGSKQTSEIVNACCAQKTDLTEKKSESRHSFLDVLSEYSMIIYLIHPLFLYYWLQWFELLGFSIAQVPVVAFYVLVLVTSLLAGMLVHKIAKKCRPVGLALLGRQPK